MTISENSCVLCTFQRDCAARESIRLFATTPVLQTLVVQNLVKAGLAHQIAHGILILEPTVSEDQFFAFAKTHFTSRETDDIRIGRSRHCNPMEAVKLTQWLHRSDTRWFDRAMESNQFTTHFQPIVDVPNGRVHGHECLVRLFADRPYNGGEILDAAVERGQTHLFDSHMRKVSVVSAAAQHAPGTRVFINFMPSSIYDPAFCMKSTFEAMENTHLQPADVVFEVVESERVTDPRHLRKICEYYRKHGFGFALDDVGTGSNSLQMVCDLVPDYIKIDKSLIQGLGDPMYRSTVGKISELAREFKVQVIAEGIEDVATAESCLSLGIDLMQGYYFSRPLAQMSGVESLANLAQAVGYCLEETPSASLV